MRYSYGIMDKKRILLYNPQLFLKGEDILIFPSKGFQNWHGNIKEYIDGLYQINYKNRKNTKTINIDDLDLAMGVMSNIVEELEQIFNSERLSDFSYQYLSTIDEKFKTRRKNCYNSDMRKCDIRIPVKPEITPWLKYQNMMQIVEEAWILFNRRKKNYH